MQPLFCSVYVPLLAYERLLSTMSLQWVKILWHIVMLTSICATVYITFVSYSDGLTEKEVCIGTNWFSCLLLGDKRCTDHNDEKYPIPTSGSTVCGTRVSNLRATEFRHQCSYYSVIRGMRERSTNKDLKVQSLLFQWLHKWCDAG